jgi:large subunit ribosomal protein L24
VQTTLLSAGIAIILALVAALVGPHFIDWGAWRSEFEGEVAHLTGLEVRVKGPIAVRLLPTPTLSLQDIELGHPGDAAKTKAQSLRIEFALGDLMRGTWRASDMVLQGPELTLGLDASGRVAWSAPTIGLDPDSVSIEHLKVAGGSATFLDAASGLNLSLGQIEFSGQVRSLIGPAKGEGTFVVDGQRYPFQLSLGRPAEDGAVKVRLNLAPTDHPYSFDVDGAIRVENRLPRFEGALQVTRPVGRSREGIVEPWRVSGHLDANGGRVLLQQIELQYGPEERPLRLKGNAALSLGARPELSATLRASQIDLDRLMAARENADRRPLVAVRRLAQSLLDAPRLPVPARLSFAAEAATVGGATLQAVGADLVSDHDGWNIDKVTLRAPGLSEIRLSGQLSSGPGGASFTGGTRIESSDFEGLSGWLAGLADPPPATSAPLHLESDLVLASNRIAFDHVKMELDRTKIEGRLDYAWPAANGPVTLDTDLSASDLDFDRLLALAQAGLGRPQWPPEIERAIDIGHTAISGSEAKSLAVKMRYDAAGLDIRRFVIEDAAGAKLTVDGHIDTREATASGKLSVDVDAGKLDGIAAVVGKFSSPIGEEIRRLSGRSVPLHLGSTLVLDRDGTGKSTIANLKVKGSAGLLRLDLQGDAAGNFRNLTDLTDVARLGGANVHFKADIEASDGGALVAALGLDRLVSVNQRSGWVKLDVNGPADGELTVKGELRAGGLDVSGNGTMHPEGAHGVTAEIALDASAAEVVPLRFGMVGRPVQQPWSNLTAKLTLADGAVKLANLDGTLAGYAVKGELGIGDAMRLNGDITLASVDVPSAIGAAIGYPHQGVGGSGAWPAEPFEPGLLGGLSGRITIKAGQVALTPKLSAHDLRAVLDLKGTELALQEIDGALAGGRVTGNLGFGRGEDGVSTHGHIELADVDAGDLIGGGASALTGKLSATLDLSGSGRSPVALIGSLGGKGSLTLRDGGIARLNPAAFDMVTRAVDRGLPIDMVRIGQRMDAALGAAPLPVPLAEGSIALNMGQLRFSDLVVHAANAELTPSGSIDLTQSAIDARLLLSAAIADDVGGGRADVTLSLKGPIDAPKRTLDVVTLTRWLALRAADQKAKRAEALEQAAREHPDDAGEATGTPGDQDQVANPSALPRPTALPPRQRPASAQDLPARRANPAPDQAPTPPPTLPPPLDIRPHGPRG